MINKIQANVNFRMRYLSTWLSWNLVIYFTVIASVFYVLIQMDLIGTHNGSLVYRIWGLVIFQFVISAKVQEDFDYFLTFSNTRKEIFYSLGTVAIVNSGIIGVIIVLEKVMVDFLNGQLGYKNIIDPFHFFSPYAVDNVLLLFLFFWTLSVALSFLGMLLGSLSYRFGKLFDYLIWLAISLLSIVYLPLALWSQYQEGRLTAVFATLAEFLGGFNVWTNSGYLLLIAIVLGTLTFLNLRRLPQK